MFTINSIGGHMLVIIIGILATYRLTQLLVIDDGPFDIFQNLRSFFYENAWPDIENKSISYRLWVSINATINEAFECPFCMGIWMAGIVVLMHFIYLDLLIFVFAIAGGQSLIERWIQTREN